MKKPAMHKAAEPIWHKAEYNELEGLITGIKACVRSARVFYDNDHVNFDGLLYLAERADLVLLGLQEAEREERRRLKRELTSQPTVEATRSGRLPRFMLRTPAGQQRAGVGGRS